MSKGRDRIVYRREDKKWVEKRLDSERAGSVSDTQREAASKAKGKLQSQGGGELIIKGMDNKIRSKDTIPPGNDPNPPKDKEH
ncbi:MAG: DUF2188 domain-containing protein [bacterium]|jgi:hypothetical protein